MNTIKYYAMVLAEIIDAYRTIPRLMVAGYAYLVWDTVQWFQLLSNPTSQHTFLVSTVIGSAAAVFGLYVNSGTSWDKKSTEKKYYFETDVAKSTNVEQVIRRSRPQTTHIDTSRADIHLGDSDPSVPPKDYWS